MTQLHDRIAALEGKLKHLKARQLKDDSRKRTLESRRSRKADTRRKILLGAIVLARIEQGRLTRTEVIAWLSQALTRSEDRRVVRSPAYGQRDQTGVATRRNDQQSAVGWSIQAHSSAVEW